MLYVFYMGHVPDVIACSYSGANRCSHRVWTRENVLKELYENAIPLGAQHMEDCFA